MTEPPDSFFAKFRDDNRDTARKFYKKYLDIKGISVAASAEVADEALQRTHFIVTHMLAGRPDILETMAKAGTRLIIIGKDQVYTDMPEYRNARNPKYLNERVRGTGGFDVTSFGEENLLNLADDRYDDESIGVHEFCHTIDAALRRIDPEWGRRLNQTFSTAMAKGLWKNTYAGSNPAEYWAETVRCTSTASVEQLEPRPHRDSRTTETVRSRRVRTDPDRPSSSRPRTTGAIGRCASSRA